MSTPSQAFTLSNTLKIVELKTLCMPVFAALVCLNVSQSIICIKKSSLYIVMVCPNLQHWQPWYLMFLLPHSAPPPTNQCALCM